MTTSSHFVGNTMDNCAAVEPSSRCVTVLGATGSIGLSTLDVLRAHKDKFSVFALTAHTQVDKLFQQCMEFRPAYAVMVCDKLALKLRSRLKDARSSTQVLAGLDSLEWVAQAPEVDFVMAAIVGAAGLRPTLSAVESGKRVLLANKETLVMGGQLFTDAVERSGAVLLPIDSEHNAIFQCLPPNCITQGSSQQVRKILLTGSGGPFLRRDKASLKNVTVEEACAHPNWSMGRKISIDSSTMMNKGLEFIEARWLFQCEPSTIEVVIHPQSIVHSMVEYIDGSVLAQLGNPDMRTPIAHCLAWPDRIDSHVKSLDFFSMGALEFFPPDFERFPCLKMAIDACKTGGSESIALNAANEIAVEAFMQARIPYGDIERVIGETLNTWSSSEPESLEAVVELDVLARGVANKVISA